MSVFPARMLSPFPRAAIALCLLITAPISPVDAGDKSLSAPDRGGRSSASSTAPAITAQSSDKIPALHLEQTHFYWGLMDVLVSAFGIRIKNKGAMKFTVVAASPKWLVTVYRSDDHTMFCEKLSDFSTDGMVATFVVTKQSRNVKETKTSPVKYGEFKARRVRKDNFFFDYLPLAKWPVQAEEILYDIYRQPTNGGLPLLSVRPRRGRDWMTGITSNDVRELLSTQKISTVLAARADFEPPAGLKQAASMQEVILSKSKRAAAGETSVLFDLK